MDHPLNCPLRGLAHDLFITTQHIEQYKATPPDMTSPPEPADAFAKGLADWRMDSHREAFAEYPRVYRPTIDMTNPVDPTWRIRLFGECFPRRKFGPPNDNLLFGMEQEGLKEPEEMPEEIRLDRNDKGKEKVRDEPGHILHGGAEEKDPLLYIDSEDTEELESDSEEETRAISRERKRLRSDLGPYWADELCSDD